VSLNLCKALSVVYVIIRFTKKTTGELDFMNPVKIGVIGCGAIGQVHHLPNLVDLYGLFEVTAVCDVSRGAAEYVADKFHVPQVYTDYRELLESDVEAVLLCQSDPKTQAAVDAFAAGKHLFIEKPMCYSLQEADAIIEAQQAAGTVGQVGYMKLFDPGYEHAKQTVGTMDSIRFVQVNHLHPNNDLHVRQFDVRRFDDIPAEAVQQTAEARQRARHDAVGDVAPHVQQAFHLLSGSMIHDLYGMREMLGMPAEILHADIWFDGRAFTMTLAYPNGARCVASWVDLPDLWDFRETLEVYGDDKRVLLAYPTGFSRGLLSSVTVQGIDAQGTTFRAEPALDWESAFMREFRHFYACIREGVECRAPVASARDDIGLIVDVVKHYLQRVEHA
jgi:predicted dehydrogenase